MGYRIPSEFDEEWVNSILNSQKEGIILETSCSLNELLDNKNIKELLQSSFEKTIQLKIRDKIVNLSLLNQYLRIRPFEEKINWTKAVNPDSEEVFKLLREVFDSCWYTNFGKFHQLLEEKVKSFFDGPEVFLVNNATIGLMLCLKYAEMNSDNANYVITSPFTFPATAHAAKFLGLKVAFADIDPVTLCLCPDATERLIKKFGSPKAVVPVHVFGNIASITDFDSLKAKYDFFLIYDAAHAFGVTYQGKNLANYGDFSVFSLHATKGFHTGEGGIVACNLPNARTKLEFLRSFGIKGLDTCFDLGINAKLSELHCVIGLALWDQIFKMIQKRGSLYNFYLEEFDDLNGIQPVINVSEEKTQNFQYATFRITEDFPISRDRLVDELLTFNIIARKYFNPLLINVPCYAEDVRFFTPNCPNSTRAANQSITLPLYPDLTTDDVRKITSIIKFIYLKYS